MAIVLQSLSAAKIGPDGSLAPDTPFWLQLASLAPALSIVGDFVAIFAWVAFGPGERHFTASGGAIGHGISVSGSANETFGRVAFGFGAALGVAIFLAFLIDGARRLFRRG